MMKQLVLAAALFGIFSTAALADDRYATRPPVVLSPDLTAPWINQLGGGTVRPVVYQRPVIQPQQRGLFQRRIIRRAPQVSPQTVSAINPGIPSIRHPIEPQYLPQMVDYDTTEKPGTIVIDTNNRFLYLVMQGGKARRYGVGVGKPGFEWAGAHKITRKTEWPDWTPPSEMISREAAKGHYLPARMDGGAETRSAPAPCISARHFTASTAPTRPGRSAAPSPPAASACATKTSSTFTTASASEPASSSCKGGPILTAPRVFSDAKGTL